MEHCRAAERALVTALVLGQVDPAELTGRLRLADFTDPAAAVLFEVAVNDGTAMAVRRDLPQLLQSRGPLRQDGYPISELLEGAPPITDLWTSA